MEKVKFSKKWRGFGRRFFWIGRRKVYRPVKDRLFRFLFEKDMESLLQLYNALNGTAYQDTSELEVVTIENAVYVTMKNDIAFVIAGTLNIYEHQSTFSPNMPVRMLIYLAQEYEVLVQQAGRSLYGMTRLMLPTPQCVVLYNGEKDMPDEQEMQLSDSFENKDREASVELKVRFININHGCNTMLMEKCRVLSEYAEFVAILRQYMSEYKLQKALNMAVDYCIDHDILSEFLNKYRSEVLGMLLEEFDVKKYERTIREEGREEGIVLINKLNSILIGQNRIEDLKRAAEDPAYQERLIKELGL